MEGEIIESTNILVIRDLPSICFLNFKSKSVGIVPQIRRRTALLRGSR